tara:strand:+ start:301 stop:1188 length:888 start_codon:yes stop_codon:yes gene_type:complete
MSQDTNTVELDIGDAEETEVDVVESNDAGDLATSSSEETSENFERAETATQKRIDRLTKKMREAERREQEAVRYAHAVQNEATQLKSQVDALDTNYVSEYSNRVVSEMERVEEQLARSIELGDSAGTVESQRKLTSLAIQADRAAQAKLQQENSRNQAFAAQQQQQYQQQQQQQQPANPVKRPDARAEQWALRNSWFGQDEAMTYAAFGIHKALVENEGFDPSGSEYYNELDRRIAGKFGGGAKTSSKRPAQTVAGASRTSNGRTGRKVRLTPSQVAIAKKLGVPLEEYAKYVKD